MRTHLSFESWLKITAKYALHQNRLNDDDPDLQDIFHLVYGAIKRLRSYEEPSQHRDSICLRIFRDVLSCNESPKNADEEARNILLFLLKGIAVSNDPPSTEEALLDRFNPIIMGIYHPNWRSHWTKWETQTLDQAIRELGVADQDALRQFYFLTPPPAAVAWEPSLKCCSSAIAPEVTKALKALSKTRGVAGLRLTLLGLTSSLEAAAP